MALKVVDIDAGQGIPITGGVAGYKEVLKAITFSSSYPTNGETLTPADFGLASFSYLHAGNASGYVFATDYTNSKLIAYRDAGSAAVMAEVPNATDLSAVTTRAVVIGPPA